MIWGLCSHPPAAVRVHRHVPAPTQQTVLTLHGCVFRRKYLATVIYFYRSQTKLGQGNIFTPVCHSVHGGGLLPGGACSWGGAWSRGYAPGGCLVQGLGGARWRPPGRLLLRAVRILLECILVTRCVLEMIRHKRRPMLCPIPIFGNHYTRPLWRKLMIT